MSNTYITPSIVAREALIALENNMVMANLVHRDYSSEFVQGVGDTVTIRKPATFVADEFSSTVTAQDITETSTSVVLDKLLDVTVAVTAKELSLSLTDFRAQVVEPAMRAHAQKIDGYLTALYDDVPYYYGTTGSTPAALSDLTGVRKVLNDNRVPFSQRSLVLDTAADEKLLQLDSVVEADKRGDAGSALREASLGRVMGMDVFMDQNIVSHTTGTLSDSSGNDLQVKGTVAAAATSMTLDATALTGTVAVGDLFYLTDASGNTFNGVVTAAATAASNEVAVAFYPAAPTGGFDDDAAVTYIGIDSTTAQANNLAFHKNAFALVTRPLTLPMGAANAEVLNYNGLSARIVYDYSASTKTDTISIDLLCGVKTIYPELAARLLG